MSDLDGFALMFWIALGGLALLLVALVIEIAEIRAMRARERRRAAIARYCDSIVDSNFWRDIK